MADDPSKHRPPPKTGSEAFGVDPDGRPSGAQAFGESEPVVPLKGALLFGNDPHGAPTGSDAFGGAEEKHPLKGALLVGNDPAGNPTGSEAFGQAEAAVPLKGALLFGNDPAGNPTGSEAFGGVDLSLQWRGADAFGAAQLVPERLHKDAIGYDFGGVLLRADSDGLAGIRKDPNNTVRERVLRLLERRLGCERDHLRHGLDEHAIPWGRLRRDKRLDKELAEELRRWYRKAPGEVLGIGHVRDLLEGSERMHTFHLRCDWDQAMVQLGVYRGAEGVAHGAVALHKQFKFFVFRAPDKRILAYVDTILPRRADQEARIRGPEGAVVATVALRTPAAAAELAEGAPVRFEVWVRDSSDQPVFRLIEQRASATSFVADIRLSDSDEPAGRLEDRLAGGKVRTTVELDVGMPRTVAWGIAAIMADLARLRRTGWPAKQVETVEEVEPIAEALGMPRRRQKT
jgi:hypothetical protein